MPRNKRESLLYTVMMCFCMVLWMSVYNVGMSTGRWNGNTLREAWLGLPLGYVVAMLCDWFLVGERAKAFAFRFLVKPESSQRWTVTAVSCCMILPMVVIMSLYGALEWSLSNGDLSRVFVLWMGNIPRNLVMAAPFQLLLAGPLVRRVFRRIFPVGTVLAQPVENT